MIFMGFNLEAKHLISKLLSKKAKFASLLASCNLNNKFFLIYVQSIKTFYYCNVLLNKNKFLMYANCLEWLEFFLSLSFNKGKSLTFG